MTSTPETKLPPGRITPPMPPEHEALMQQHLRDEKLPEAVMPATPINKVLKGQKALVTGANSGIGQAVALLPLPTRARTSSSILSRGLKPPTRW